MATGAASVSIADGFVELGSSVVASGAYLKGSNANSGFVVGVFDLFSDYLDAEPDVVYSAATVRVSELAAVLLL